MFQTVIASLNCGFAHKFPSKCRGCKYQEIVLCHNSHFLLLLFLLDLSFPLLSKALLNDPWISMQSDVVPGNRKRIGRGSAAKSRKRWLLGP